MKIYEFFFANKIDGYMTLLREMKDGYIVKIQRFGDIPKQNYIDYISKTLFNSCIRTGFIKEIQC